MKLLRNIVEIILLTFLIIPSVVIAQEVSWDKYDKTRGSNPTLRYGFYTDSDGKIQSGRYYFIDDGVNLRIRLAPYGKTPAELPVLEFDRTEGILKLGWEGRPNCFCRLIQENESLFLGNCIEGNNVMPIAIRTANEFEKEWRGGHFAVSETDIQILKRAKEILLTQNSRNLNGDRNCDDDISTGNFSLFCAVYYASIEVDGVYRHGRPSRIAVVKAITKQYPEYDYRNALPGQHMIHAMRDFNNNPNFTNHDLVNVIDSALVKLTLDLNSRFNKK